MSSFSFRSRAAVIAAAAALACGAVMAQPSVVDQEGDWPGLYPWVWNQVYNKAEGVWVWTFGHRGDTNGTHDGWFPVGYADGGASPAWVPANMGSIDPEDVDKGRGNDD